jgi:ABC-type sugar transport system substrate-binding protein
MTHRAALVCLLAVLAAGCGGDKPAPGNGSTRVAAVIKGLDNPFFATMKDGLDATARHHRARLGVDAAAGLQDTAGQAAALESRAAERAGCYVVNPINGTNLVEPLAHVPHGTPIINIDSPVDRQAAKAVGVGITTYIGTDNVAAGRAAAETMDRFVGPAATVAVIAGIPGDVSSADRTSGFMLGARGRFDVAPPVAADFDGTRARLAAAELLRGSAPPEGFFAVNDEMALGIAEAVRAAGRRGAVAVIGVDGSQRALAAVRSGAMSATVSQYPYTIGQLGVEACLATIRGKTVPAYIDAPVQVVTKANVAQAQANFPRPVERFVDPLAQLLKD